MAVGLEGLPRYLEDLFTNNIGVNYSYIKYLKE